MSSAFSITIGRQLGSGGKKIAQLLAEEFNCKLFDSEILSLAAKESGFTEKLFKSHDEHHGRLHNLIFNKIPNIGHGNYYNEQVSQGSLFEFQSDVIRHEADKGPSIFVGRCADYILREQERLVSVFVYADIEDRVQNIAIRSNYSKEEARKFIKQEENRRARFYNYYTGQKWGDKEFYDICINSSRLGIEATAKILAAYIHQRLGI